MADVVPLTGLNRALVTQGLKILARRRNPGLVALAPGQLLMSYYSDVAYYISGQIRSRYFPEFRYKETDCDIYIAEIEVGCE